ncbi:MULTISPECIES: hypothetical protein [Micromonospora]|uniref:hypothetical protein n=1 Tax=Micromonospora TaxID=1873 RepID=UPI0018F72584|nr:MULTISPECIES: hypothetical protein [Micromonospora]
MTFSVGIFDLFTYLTPGSLYLTLAGRLAVRLDVVQLGRVQRLPGVLLVAGFALFSYVLGGATYGLGRIVDLALPFWRWARFDARRVFEARLPAAAGSPMLDAPNGVLLAAAELHNREVTAEVTRMRAIGLMLRNVTVPLLVGAALAGVEVARGHGGAAMVTAALALAATAAGAAWRSVVLRFWAERRTLELCFFVPGLEDRLRGPVDNRPATTGQAARDAAAPVAADTAVRTERA